MNRYQEVRKFYENQIIAAEKTENFYIMKMTIFCLIDSLVQEYFNYVENENRKKFINFINKFASDNYARSLKLVEPVSFINDSKRKFRKFNNDLLCDGNNYTISQLNGSKDIKNWVKNISKENNINSYTLDNALYTYRNKLVHEYRMIGSNFGFLEENDEISYISVQLSDNENEWQYNIPYKWLRGFFFNILNNYLNYCKNSDRDPFENCN